MQPERNRLERIEDAFAAILTVGLTVGFVGMAIHRWPHPAPVLEAVLVDTQLPDTPAQSARLDGLP